MVRRRLYWLAGLAIVLVALVAACLVVGALWDWMTRFDEVAFERDMRRELPVGSNYEQIERYLQTKRIYYELDESENIVRADMPDVERRLFTSKSIKITIALDDQKRLQSLEVRTYYTGP